MYFDEKIDHLTVLIVFIKRYIHRYLKITRVLQMYNFIIYNI